MFPPFEYWTSPVFGTPFYIQRHVKQPGPYLEFEALNSLDQSSHSPAWVFIVMIGLEERFPIKNQIFATQQVLFLQNRDQNFGDLKSLTIIPLRAKRVEEFIEIRHKKISPTRIRVPLGVCDSVTLWPINPPIISAACHGIGPNFF